MRHAEKSVPDVSSRAHRSGARPRSPGRSGRALGAFLLLTLGPTLPPSDAQQPQRPGARLLDAAARRQASIQEQVELQHVQTGEMALETAVDPARYRMAPGDRVAISIWGTTDEVMQLAVAADGALVVPSVGVVPVAGLTLNEASEQVRDRCRELYPNAEVTLTLVRPALLRVPITGLVAAPGIYEVLATYRLGDLLTVAGGVLGGADLRRVEVHGADGETRICDFLAWRVDGEEAGNPALRSGDRMHIPPLRHAYRVRGLLPSGLEDAPDRSAFVDRPFEARSRLIAARDGDTLDFVLRAAGGPRAELCADGVWVLRATDEGGDTRRIWVPAGETAGFAMQPGDAVELPFCGDWVAVGGAVTRPGLYPYLPGETVADYVYAAGGPNQFGRSGGWKVRYPGDEKDHGAAASDSVIAGSRIRVPERREHTLSVILTPVATAVALIVSVVALAR